MNDKKQKIFVTGGTGFLGSYLLRYLIREGYTSVRALRRKDSRLDLLADAAQQVEWVEGDVRDYDALEEGMKGADAVIHSAAIVSFDSRDRKLLTRVNVEGTANAVNAALHCGVPRFIHVSSVSALGRVGKTGLVDESARYEPGVAKLWYGLTKYQAEMEVWRGREEGLSVAVVNPSLILGSGDWKGSGTPNVFHKIGTGFPFYATGQNGVVDVRDAARFILLLLERGSEGERYILNAENWMYKDLFAAIAQTMGRRAPWIPVTPLIGGVAWRAELLRAMIQGKRPLITRETVSNTRERWAYANDKSRALGFEYTPMIDTIADTARQWMESRGEEVAVLPLV
jgi:dihydroflavonol-4-reductase